jgi:hypothetical protein
MTAGLFDATPHDPLDRGDGEAAYRAIPGTAIAAAVLALLSPLAFFGWPLLAVPAIGLVLGVTAFSAIANRPQELLGKPLALAATVVSAAMLVGGIVVLARAYAAELPAGYERIHYGILQPLPGDPPHAIPDTARAVDGHTVLLKGYMYPGKQQHGITQFLLVRDQGDCCFGGNPKITDRVLVQLRDPQHPQGIDFSPRLTKIAGRFVIRPTASPGLDGGVVYHLEDAFAR